MKFNIRVQGNRQRQTDGGMCPVRLYISFNSQKGYLSTGINWPIDLIDNKNGVIIQGNQNLNEYSRAQAELSKLIEKVSNILSNGVQDFQELKSLSERNSGQNDFIKFATETAKDRLINNQINFNTWKAQTGSIAALKDFKSPLYFDSINVSFLESYKIHLQKSGFERNTIWSRLKDFRTYLNLAIKSGIQFEYPFGKGFKMPSVKSRLDYLYESEFQSIKEYYQSTENIGDRTVLRAFLFSCYTGLRISDIQNIRGKNFRNGVLRFSPLKTIRSETKQFTELEIPLHPFALDLSGETFKEVPVFHDLPSEQKINKRLKRIARDLNIDKAITFHYSRHTFATRFLAAGGKIEVLQKLMGHESIKTTMIYTHIEPTTARKAIHMMS